MFILFYFRFLRQVLLSPHTAALFDPRTTAPFSSNTVLAKSVRRPTLDASTVGTWRKCRVSSTALPKAVFDEYPGPSRLTFRCALSEYVLT